MSIDLTTAVGRVRDMIGDVDETNLILSDATIALYVPGGMLGQTTEYLAGAMCATLCATRVLTKAQSISEGGASVNWGDRAKRFREIAADLRAVDAVASSSSDALFDSADIIVDDFGYRERVANELLRSGV